MQTIIRNLQQALLNEHIPNEQVQDIINSVDTSQLNPQDIPATTEYLSQFLGSMNLQENIISHINTNLAENFGNLGINTITDVGIDKDGLWGKIQSIFGDLFGKE